MSTYQKYDPALFSVERQAEASAMLGLFVIGESKLGVGTGGWVPVECATATITAGYHPDPSATLIIDADTGTVSQSFWDYVEPDSALYPGDAVRLTYAGKVLFTGTVDSTSTNCEVDPAAAEHGATMRVDFSATIAGQPALAMSKTITWKSLPAESAYDRITRWVTVDGWS